MNKNCLYIIIFSFCSILGCRSIRPANDHPDLVITANKIEAVENSLNVNNYPNLHSIIINQSGKTLFEEYFSGTDYDWGGEELGLVKHSSETLHDTRSISKSIVSACVGIAIERGFIDSVNQKVFDFFPEYTQFGTEQKDELTVYHLLTMTDGLNWDESGTPKTGSEIEMENSEDKIEFILSKHSKFKPGKKWNYNSGATELLAQIIKRTTNKDIYQFATEYIFNPLDIKVHEWITYSNDSLPAAASGLRLRSPDLLKIGLLYLNKGEWNGKQIIPTQWVKQSLKTQILKEEFQEIKAGYGYQFWTWEQPSSKKSFHIAVAHGLGDQEIFIDQKNEIVIIITSGNYNKKDSHFNSIGILNTIYNDIN